MIDSFDKFIDEFLRFRGETGEFLGPALPWLELFSLVLSIFFIYAIIYSMSKSQWLRTRMDDWHDVWGTSDLGKRRRNRSWKQVVDSMKSKDPKDWQKAVNYADRVLGEALRLSGYKGLTIHDRLSQVAEETLPVIEELKLAHKFKEELVNNLNIQITHSEISKIIKVYERALRDLEVIG